MFQLDRILPLKNGQGHVLVVMEMECSNDKKIIMKKMRTLGITKVEVIIKTRSEIVVKITCVLEHTLSSYLVGTKQILLDHSHSHKVDSNLLEVNAILKRLKQAECYPEPLAGFVEPENNEIDDILQRFVTLMQYLTQYWTMYVSFDPFHISTIELFKTRLIHFSRSFMKILINVLIDCQIILHLWITNIALIILRLMSSI